MTVMDILPTRFFLLDELLSMGLFSITQACGYCKSGVPEESPTAVEMQYDTNTILYSFEDDDGFVLGLDEKTPWQ